MGSSTVCQNLKLQYISWANCKIFKKCWDFFSLFPVLDMVFSGHLIFGGSMWYSLRVGKCMFLLRPGLIQYIILLYNTDKFFLKKIRLFFRKKLKMFKFWIKYSKTKITFTPWPTIREWQYNKFDCIHCNVDITKFRLMEHCLMTMKINKATDPAKRDK